MQHCIVDTLHALNTADVHTYILQHLDIDVLLKYMMESEKPRCKIPPDGNTIRRDGCKVPPDGGWGWMIVFANALSNTVSLPVLTGFGLIFKDKLADIGMPVKDISTITSSNSACSMLIGLFTGPLLKHFGYRKVAFTAGLMFTTGIILMVFSNCFSNFIISYSILTASGYGLSNSSFSLALNTYFRKKRSKAAGTAVTITGLGPIFYPPLITALLSYYGVNGCVLILAGLSLHILVAALLLQPIRYHLINKSADEELEDLNEAKEIAFQVGKMKPIGCNERNHATQIAESIPNATEENSLVEKINRLENYRFYGFDNSMEETANGSCENFKSSGNVKLNGSFLFDDQMNVLNNSTGCGKMQTVPKLEANLKKVSTKDEKQLPNEKSNSKYWIVRFFDLDLLKDVVFLNIIVGMAIATFAEISFSTLTPFILSDMAFSTIEIASFLSTLSVADIAARFLSPFVGDYFSISARVMYIFGLLLLVITRMSVLFCDNFTKLLMVGACLGAAKGIRTVYMILVIPNHVTINKLASASGIRMVANGLVLLCLGPVVGWIRDFSGSYVICIIFMNCITLTCITLWTTEILYFKFKYKQSKT